MWKLRAYLNGVLIYCINNNNLWLFGFLLIFYFKVSVLKCLFYIIKMLSSCLGLKEFKINQFKQTLYLKVITVK